MLKRIPSQFILYKDNNNLEENFHASSILNQMIAKTKGEPYKILFNSKFLTDNFMFIDIDSKKIKTVFNILFLHHIIKILINIILISK